MLIRSLLRAFARGRIPLHSIRLPAYCHQPCLCLCFGFSQMIMILPFLLITLHFSQIGFTDDRTFIPAPLLSFLYI